MSPGSTDVAQCMGLIIQGCLANSDGANSDDRANSDDFLGKSLNFFPSYFLLFLGILTT